MSAPPTAPDRSETAGFFADLPDPEPSGAVGFAGGRLVRRSENRSDDAVACALTDPAARIYLLAEDRVLLNGSGPHFAAAEARAAGADPAETVLLGWDDATPRLAALVPDAEPADAAEHATLRALASEARLPPAILGDLALARSLVAWHDRHRFCANCGTPTRMGAGGFRRFCPSCSALHFPRTDPVVIMLVLDGERALLGRSARFVPGVYSCLAGFMEPGETIEDAVRRETAEESGIAVGRVGYHASQPWPFPSSLMIGCYGEALSTDIDPDDDELEDCRWFDRDEVVAMLADTHPDGIRVPVPMAIAHRLIADWASG